MQTEDFWASGTKHRKDIKLHIYGSCPSTPGINVKDFIWAATPQDVKWTTLCKKCWKGIPAPGETPRAPEDMSGSSSTSSTSQTRFRKSYQSLRSGSGSWRAGGGLRDQGYLSPLHACKGAAIGLEPTIRVFELVLHYQGV